MERKTAPAIPGNQSAACLFFRGNHAPSGKRKLLDYSRLKKEFPVADQPTTPFFVSIAGNIGVGKSSITTMIGEIFGWRMFFEPVINNPYLEDYYQDMKRWSFHLQVYFLSKRFEVQKQILETGMSAVQDRTIYEDVEIFAPTLHKRGCMDDRDYENYREIFRNMAAFLRPPDLIIYLKCTPQTALYRINLRGRGCESDIPLDFLEGLHAAYEDWIERAPALCPVRTIDTEQVSLLDSHEDQRSLLSLIDGFHQDKHRRVTGGGES
jgi:deoxyadenosine/deoxycytidine kinase